MARRRRRVDPARRVAFDTLRAVHADDAYANIALADHLNRRQLSPRDAAFATELVAGTCRGEGSYDRVIVAAAGRPLKSFQPAVVDVLRLGTHQLLALRVPDHAAVAASVDLAAVAVGERVTGLVNAVLRKVSAHTADQWWDRLAVPDDPVDRLALEHQHPRWTVEAYLALLGEEETAQALAANNVAPRTTLVARPGLCEVSELVGATPTQWSPHGAIIDGDPGSVTQVRTGTAGVQDEGSQLVTLAAARVAGPGSWLDLCAGPGGKSALLTGLATRADATVISAELHPHRARLVRQGLRAYPGPHRVVVADGTRGPWRPASQALVLADVPCSGLGALRRRPESRWRRTPHDVAELTVVQRSLLHAAVDTTEPGGVSAYVTCSPHRAETVDIVDAVLAERADVTELSATDHLPEVPNAELGKRVQLWPHRHGTDAMFLALLRRR